MAAALDHDVSIGADPSFTSDTSYPTAVSFVVDGYRVSSMA